MSQELIAAIDADDGAVVARLVAADPGLARARGEDGISALLRSLYRRRPAALAALVAAQPELDVFEAAALDRVEELAALLAADPALALARSADGFTPLHYAAFFGGPAGAEALLAAGAEVDAVAEQAMRVTPLNSAAAARAVAVARVLLDRGADVDAHAHGFTPLHSAAQGGDLGLVELLLERGARRDLRTPDGKTAEDLALAHGHPAVAARLRTSRLRTSMEAQDDD